jgi:hypothetical protein
MTMAEHAEALGIGILKDVLMGKSMSQYRWIFTQ